MIKLGQYKGLHIRKPDTEVPETQILRVLQNKQKQNACVLTIDRTAADGSVETDHVMELQPIDDDFAKDFSEYQTLDDWKAAIRAKLEARRIESAQERISRQLLEMITDASDIPVDDELTTEVAMQLFDDFLDELDMHNVPLELYCKRNSVTEEQIQADKEAEAILLIKSQTVLHAIVEEEGLELSAEELQEELAVLAEEAGMDVSDFVEELGEEEIEAYAEDLLTDKAMQLIIDHAIFE